MSEVAQVEGLPKVTKEQPWMPYEEQAIISFAFDEHETFAQAIPFLKKEHFRKVEHQFIFEIIRRHFEKHEVVPTRSWALDVARRNLGPDDDFIPILEGINRESNPRDLGAVKKTIIDWTKHKAYAQLLTKEAVDAIVNHQYEAIDQLVEEARRITNVENIGIDFFNAYPLLLNKENIEMLPTGFPQLDALLNGGLERGRVFMWQAATNVGKSIFLVHNGRVCVEKGYKVLHITLEMSEEDVGVRYLGAFTNEIKDLRFEPETKAAITAKLEKAKATYGNNLKIVQFPPDEISVDNIYQLIETYKRKGWSPDVIIIDYLELMRARRAEENKENWQAQAKVSTQICGLAKNTNTLVFTATQSNRDGYKESENEAKIPGLDKTAGSYDKTKPVDYVCGIAQTSDEYKEGIYRISLEKSRHGAKKVVVRAKVNYSTMRMGSVDPVK